jgi:DNA phosphorothioation-dependent restriction protein DptG
MSYTSITDVENADEKKITAKRMFLVGLIAQQLQVSPPLVPDVEYLPKEAKESFHEYVTEHLPEQYQYVLSP